MKNIAIAVFIAAIVAGFAYAGDQNFAPKDKYCVVEKIPTAKGPAGTVVETAGTFVGKLASAIEIAVTGERKITVENQTGETRIFPFSTTTKIVDSTFNAATFDQLKKGEQVKVDYSKEGGIETAKEVTIQK